MLIGSKYGLFVLHALNTLIKGFQIILNKRNLNFKNTFTYLHISPQSLENTEVDFQRL